MTRTKSKRIFIGFGIFITLLVIAAYVNLAPGISFLRTYMNPQAPPAPTIRQLRIESGTRMIPARLYAPSGSPKGTIVLIHGVHADGYNEKRLMHFTNTLVDFGFQVVTPDIEDLRKYQIVERAVTDIRRSASWVLKNGKIVKKEEKIGLWGISFAGGLCLSLAGSPEFGGRIASSFSFGGHSDLDATIKYLMTGNTPSGNRPPHVYGQAVLVRKYAYLLVPNEQKEALQSTVRYYLQGDYDIAKKMSRCLPPESRRYSRLIFQGDQATLGRLLQRAVSSPNSPASLSAIRNSAPKNAVFLLHGSMDNVIPPHESQKLATWAEHGSNSVHLLISPLINHVELEEHSAGNTWISYFKIIRFWANLLRATEN
ncbi:MAG: hypothetical protein JXX29_20840 [Deltaproteobacteria bacterium]|nr:hypothetical protein [Deltaproteobacteria bacterium]MBN2674141.1 hypothetical protein [Deltaproteobacteria bacterium]